MKHYHENSPARLSILIFVICILFYGLIWSGHHYSIDGVVMFQYAKALAFDQSFFMEPPVVWGDFDFVVSKWAIGLSLAYIPVLGFLALTFFQGNPELQQIPFVAGDRFNIELLANPSYQYSSVLNPLLTAGTAVILFLLALKLNLSQKQAYITALIFGLLSPATVYAKFDYSQTLASSLILLAVFFFVSSPIKTIRNLIATGICIGFAILTRTEYLIILPPIFIIATHFLETKSYPITRKHIQNIIAITLPIILFIGANLIINQIRFGAISSVGYSPTSEFSFELRRIFTAFVGNLISPGRGLFLFFPLTLLSFWGYRQFFRQNRFFALVMGALIVGQILFYATWRDWGGGNSWGPRFLIPLIPYITLLGVWGYQALNIQAKFARPIMFGILVLVGGIVTLNGILFNFLDFYGRVQIPAPIISQGDYNFQFQYAPLFASWIDIIHPEKFDVYWMQSQADDLDRLIVLVIFIVLISLLIYTSKSVFNVADAFTNKNG